MKEGELRAYIEEQEKNFEEAVGVSIDELNNGMQCPDCNVFDRFTHREGKFHVCKCGGHKEDE